MFAQIFLNAGPQYARSFAMDNRNLSKIAEECFINETVRFHNRFFQIRAAQVQLTADILIPSTFDGRCTAECRCRIIRCRCQKLQIAQIDLHLHNAELHKRFLSPAQLNHIAFLVHAWQLHLIAGLNLSRGLAAAPGHGFLARRRFSFIQAAAGFNQLVLLNGSSFLHRQTAQTANDFLSFLACLVENGTGILLRLLQPLVTLALQLLQLQLLPLAEFLRFPADNLCPLAFVLCG
ncbi:hypothetical protein D3C75_767040 [compost metagenome]